MSNDTATPSKVGQYATIGAVAGFILGYPVSYYFQSSVVRAKLSLGNYIAKASEIVGNKDLQSAVVLGFVVAIAVCVAAGVVLGKVMDQKR